MLAPAEFVADPRQMQRVYSLDESLAYTRWLATHHYENFHVVSFLLPKHLHQDFYNVYSFCRWADDLGDEIGNTTESLRLLAWWRHELNRAYADPGQGGGAGHPVYVALRQTITRHSLPADPFHDLITAFEHDQRVTRYANWTEVLDYCKYSANPVGRLVLLLCGYRDAERFRMSDATCSALQLANFWQDVSVDWKKDRVYLPQDLLARHGASDADIASSNATPGFRAALEEACAKARELFLEGLPLARTVNRRLSLDLELFSQGGLKILDKVAQQNYDVLTQRPHISKSERASLLLATLARWAFSKAA